MVWPWYLPASATSVINLLHHTGFASTGLYGVMSNTMSFTYCPNCTGFYEPDFTVCPDCGASADTPGGKITFTDAARTEISRLGGIIGDFLPLTDEHWLLPCGWGIVVYKATTQTLYSYFSGALVVAVTIREDDIELTVSTGKQHLPINLVTQ